MGIYGRYDWEDRSTAERARFVDFLERMVVKRRIDKHPDIFRKASPIARVHAEAPPFLVVHGTGDSVIPVAQARSFVERLRAVSHSVVGYVELPGAGHAFDMIDGARTGSDVDRNRVVPQPDSPKPLAHRGEEGYIGSPGRRFDLLKRLSGWDAVLLYSETPTVHMHTLKLAVIDVSELKGRHFGVDEFREVIRGRLHKLDPFCYQLVDVPFKFHHPMWRENCEVDLEYHVRPYRVDSPGGRRELDDAVGRIASTPLDRSRPLWEMYFIEGLANGRIAVLGKIHHALADGVASANLLARGMDLQQSPQPDRDSYACEPPPTKGELLRTAFADHMRHIGRLPGVMRYTAQGVSRVRKSSKKCLTGADTAVHAAAVVHESPRRRAAQVRHHHTGPRGRQGDQQAPRRHHQRHGARDLFGGAASAVTQVRRTRRPPAIGFRPSQFRLLTGPDIRQPFQRRHDGGADRTRRSP